MAWHTVKFTIEIGGKFDKPPTLDDLSEIEKQLATALLQAELGMGDWTPVYHPMDLFHPTNVYKLKSKKVTKL